MNVLDAAMLDVDAGDVEVRIDHGTVLVTVADGRVLGACVVSPDGSGGHVEAIAVRPGRRARGVGSAMVAEAASRWGELTAEFDAGVRPFYESLGFDTEPVGEGRFRGRLLDAE